MFDNHMHCNYSSDTDVPMEDMILGAIKNGVRQITFTDHIDYDYNSPEIDFEFDTEVYAKEIAFYREKYASNVKINLGLEIGIQPHILEKCEKLVASLKPDFIIASQHNVARKDLYLGDYYKGKDPVEALRYAMNELAEMIEVYDAFSVIGHVDILKRYDEAVRALDRRYYLEFVKPVFEKLIQKGKGIEVNTSGLRQGLSEPLPSYELLQLYYDMGGRILSIGSDAHKPEDVGHSFGVVYQKLWEIGFRQLYTFEKMVPVAHELSVLLAHD